MHFRFYLGDSSRIGLNLQFNSDVKSGLSPIAGFLSLVRVTQFSQFEKGILSIS